MTLHWRHTEPRSEIPVVFLPGWGFGGRILELAGLERLWTHPEGLVDPASCRQELLTLLEEKGWPRIRLVGWSMGGGLALDFAREHPDRIEDLYLLATRRAWPEPEIEAIRRDFDLDPTGYLASFYRKCFLGERRLYRRFQAELEPLWLQAPPLEVLRRGLEYLARARTAAAPVRTRLVHGRRDLIAPLAEQADLPAAAPEILPQAGHLVFLSPDFSLARKEKIRRSFSQAASTYDQHATLQQKTARLLAARLPEAEIGSILELGCGTGAYSLLLAERYPRAGLLAVDFSAAMLQAARAKLGRRTALRFQCEDAEDFLARHQESFDLITSNATLQWFADPETAMGHIARLLNPSGVFLASFFGPATLEELRQGLSLVLDREISLPSSRFSDAAVLRRFLTRHFQAAALEEVRVSRQYNSLPDLLRQIRRTGTAGWRETPPLVLTRERLHRLDEWFGSRFGGYRLTYQILFLKGVK